MQDLSEIDSLKKEIEVLKSKKKKDFWDILQILLGTTLIPVAIAVAGYFFSSSLKSAEIRSNEYLTNMQVKLDSMQAIQEEKLARLSIKVNQANLVSNFFEALLSQDLLRKKLAIEAILIALPDEGPKLVQIVSISDPASAVQSFAQESLNKRRTKLVNEMFHPDKDVRINAYNELFHGWRDDPEIIPLLVESSKENMDNADGIYNTALLFNQLPVKSLEAFEQEINEFIEEAETVGPQTKKKTDQLQEKLAIRRFN